MNRLIAYNVWGIAYDRKGQNEKAITHSLGGDLSEPHRLTKTSKSFLISRISLSIAGYLLPTKQGSGL